MKVTIEINCDNAAFLDYGKGGESYEVARILHDLAKRIDGNPHFSDGYSMPLRDYNGNLVGYLDVKGS